MQRTLLKNVALLVFCLLPLHVRAQERVSCTASGPGFRCRIDAPNVKQRVSEYRTIRFRPGDHVRLNGGGCAQTGGSGRTWKRYVNPQGPNSDRLYHGLVQIPGAMPDLRRLADLIGQTLVVPAGTDASQLFLRLGYEDDGYGDNGYWGHDDGTGDQCKNVGNAFVELTVERGLPTPLACQTPAGTSAPDGDGDGIADACEQALAEEFAPVIYHSSDESNYPTNVDLFLRNTSLWFYDDDCTPDLKEPVRGAPTQQQLLTGSRQGGCGSTDTVFSNGTRSQEKQRTFFLADVPEQFRVGSLNSSDWTTYFHAYRNEAGGVTVQYWRFYAYNDAVNNHGGDWEGFHLVLDAGLRPAHVDFLGHTTIAPVQPSGVQWEGDHPRIFSEGGGHASRPSGAGIQARGCPARDGCFVNPDKPFTFVRQETWPGGEVKWFDGRVGRTGALVNLGEKLRPLNGQVFIQYSGIWGSPGTFFGTSGYWGPAFNETEMGADGFIKAWCSGMTSPTRARECFPSARSR
ncbi:MAG TPA: hypothetical protein VM936_03295 [Pyrinomonadaceae bacterium]|jgi:hypothetical protein|nr:hypothetical protein [Pyrinomonadaceae bacterium]